MGRLLLQDGHQLLLEQGHRIILESTGSVPVAGAVLRLQDGFALQLEDGSRIALETAANPIAAGSILSEAGFSLLLEDGSRLLLGSSAPPASFGLRVQDGGALALEDGSRLLLEGGAAVVSANLHEAIWSRLVGSDGITEVVGSRIYYYEIPQKRRLPALVYQIPTFTFGRHLCGSDGTAMADVQLDCFSPRQAQCNGVMESVRRRFDGFRGWIGDVEILSCAIGSAGDLPEPPLFRSMATYAIKYRVPIPDQLQED